MGSQEHNAFEERRHASRFGRDEETEFAAVWLTPSEEVIVPVCDESLGGLSLLIDDPSRLSVGGEVGIAYAESFFRATVVHLRARGDGKYVVGFKTTQPR